MSWWVEGLISRRAQFSTVIVFKTLDPKRVEQFMQFLQQDAKTSIYYFIPFKGLSKIENGSFIPISTDTGFGEQRIVDLETALRYMDNIFKSTESVCFVLFGVQRNDTLTLAVRAWVFDTEIYKRKHTIVIFSESPETLFDEETLRYLIVSKVPKSTKDEREQVITKIAQVLNLKPNGILTEITSGLNLHELESILLKSIYKYKDLRADVLQEYKQELINKSGILSIESTTRGFESVGGYDSLKAFVQNNIINVLKNPKKAEKLGIRPPRGVLLFGMGGTGKTWFAKALSKEIGLPFLRLKTEQIVSKWYGETERSMAKALELAEEVAPCILFIDEIDRFGQRGQIGEHETSRRTFSILLEWLGDENRKTIVVGTTNRPQDLDEAFIRVGRFDYIVPMLLPDEKARLQILDVHTKIIRKVPLSKDVDLNSIAKRTEMFTGAEIEELVLRSARNALKENREKVTMQDFESALKTFRINFDQRRKQLEEYLRLAERFCNDAEFLQTLKSESVDRFELLKQEL
ncbi:MAG: ATP-binding protein [Candidatus Bathyarchaeia archaeon]